MSALEHQLQSTTTTNSDFTPKDSNLEQERDAYKAERDAVKDTTAKKKANLEFPKMANEQKDVEIETLQAETKNLKANENHHAGSEYETWQRRSAAPSACPSRERGKSSMLPQIRTTTTELGVPVQRARVCASRWKGKGRQLNVHRLQCASHPERTPLAAPKSIKNSKAQKRQKKKTRASYRSRTCFAGDT